jgi:hypothetical protein
MGGIARMSGITHAPIEDVVTSKVKKPKAVKVAKAKKK